MLVDTFWIFLNNYVFFAKFDGLHILRDSSLLLNSPNEIKTVDTQVTVPLLELRAIMAKNAFFESHLQYTETQAVQ